MKILYFVIIVIIINIGCHGHQNDQIFKVKQGKFKATITETGELQAVNSRVVVMPWLGWKYGRPKLAKLVAEGIQVKTGDFVAQAEISGIIKFLKEKENELQMAKADLRKMQVNHDNMMRQIEAQLASAEASFNLETIQAEKIRFESERRKKIGQLKLEKAKISLEKVKQKLEATTISQENELEIQKLKIFIAENEIKDAHRALNKANIVAPNNGLVEYKQNRRTQQKVRAGDELWPGAPIIGIPDLSRMKVKTSVNEADINKLRLGQQVTVRLDAFPKIPFPGEIIEIAKLCHEKEKDSLIKLFDIVIVLEKSDPILKPGMTVSCEIFTSQLEDVLYIENECVLKENTKYYLYVKNKSKLEKQEIDIGSRNNEYTVIYGDISKGDKVVVKK